MSSSDPQPSAEAVAAKIRDSAVRRITGLEPLDGSGKEEVEAFEKSALFFLREYGREREREALERAARVADEEEQAFMENGRKMDAGGRWQMGTSEINAALACKGVATRIRALVGSVDRAEAESK